MSVDPTGADLKKFVTDDPGGPVVMVNMLQFSPGGAASYREYSERVGPFLAEVGADIVYAGNLATPMVAPDGWAWDAILLVRYPSRAAFSAMVANPDYQQITGLRSAGLDAAILQPSAEWGA